MDYDTPQKAVIISGSRVGSTWLCTMLDSHPQISCERSEPLNPTTSPYLQEGLSPQQTLRLVLERSGYRVCLCKVSYRQLKKVMALEDLCALGVTKFIHLWRENVLRVVVSAALNTSARNGERAHPTHAYQTPPLSPITLDPQKVVSEGLLYMSAVAQMKKRLTGKPLLSVTYEAMVNDPKGTGWALCSFLDVEQRVLQRDLLQPVNPYPLSEIISNWEAVRAKVQTTALKRWLE